MSLISRILKKLKPRKYDLLIEVEPTSRYMALVGSYLIDRNPNSFERAIIRSLVKHGYVAVPRNYHSQMALAIIRLLEKNVVVRIHSDSIIFHVYRLSAQAMASGHQVIDVRSRVIGK